MISTVTCVRCHRHVDSHLTKIENGLPVCDPKRDGFIAKTCKPVGKAAGASKSATEKKHD